MVWLAFILSGYLLALDRHITIQLVDYVLPPRALGALKLFVHVVVGATCLAMAYSIYDLDRRRHRPAHASGPDPASRGSTSCRWSGFLLTTLRAALWIVVADIPQIRGRGGAVA